MEEYELVLIQGNQMSGDVFLSELFIRALSRIPATEQICVLIRGSHGFGIYGTIWYLGNA